MTSLTLLFTTLDVKSVKCNVTNGHAIITSFVLFNTGYDIDLSKLDAFSQDKGNVNTIDPLYILKDFSCFRTFQQSSQASNLFLRNGNP